LYYRYFSSEPTALQVVVSFITWKTR